LTIKSALERQAKSRKRCRPRPREVSQTNRFSGLVRIELEDERNEKQMTTS
jgi:hypothetical protein